MNHRLRKGRGCGKNTWWSEHEFSHLSSRNRFLQMLFSGCECEFGFDFASGFSIFLGSKADFEVLWKSNLCDKFFWAFSKLLIQKESETCQPPLQSKIKSSPSFLDSPTTESSNIFHSSFLTLRFTIFSAFVAGFIVWEWHEYMFGDFSPLHCLRRDFGGIMKTSLKPTRAGLWWKHDFNESSRLRPFHARLITFWLISGFFGCFICLAEIKPLPSTACENAHNEDGRVKKCRELMRGKSFSFISASSGNRRINFSSSRSRCALMGTWCLIKSYLRIDFFPPPHQPHPWRGYVRWIIYSLLIRAKLFTLSSHFVRSISKVVSEVVPSSAVHFSFSLHF